MGGRAKAVQASSSPPGEPPSAMSTDSVGIYGEETEIPASSQELVEQSAATSNLGQKTDHGLNHGECGNTESETEDAADEASADSDYKPPPSTAPGVTTRSRAKKETQSVERTTRSSADRSNAAKRNHEAYQSETTRPLKRGRPTSSDTTIKKFKTQACALMETFASNARELENATSENQELKRQIKRLDLALKQEQEKYLQKEAAQRKDIDQLEIKCKILTSKLVSALEEAKKGSGKYVKVSDLDIRERWTKLSYNIQQMVSLCLTERPIEQNDILHSLLIELERPMPEFDYEYILLRGHILRRTIWHFLMKGIFEGEYSIWHGDSGRTLTKFLAVQNEGHLEDTRHLKMISQIKSTAIAELGDEIQLNEEAIDELTSIAMMAVQGFIPNSTKDSASEATEEALLDRPEKFQAMFKGLIAEAACLHTIMMKSKAIFLLQWIGETHDNTVEYYDPNNMTTYQYGLSADSSLFVVEFVEAPALVKIGNADGEDFHLRMTLCKSSVVLEERDTHSPLRTTHFISDSEDGDEDSEENGSLSPLVKEESKDD
ncbi:hypothetical protein THARTR1_05589 [Trichoderma harzianum]|uniref:Uncharacterized protein n=1 Tax=Trichoderma harzianum TaxID=5544 RepID=A0A2K0U9B7_TRIHA|nr:hypothetical protein THARTR1_05589 [Trichoderma harzianum]